MGIKSKFWTITVIIPTIVLIATMGTLTGVGQQQIALAQSEEELQEQVEEEVGEGLDVDVDVDLDEGQASINFRNCPPQFENCALDTVIAALGCDIVREIPGTGGGLECIIFFP